MTTNVWIGDAQDFGIDDEGTFPLVMTDELQQFLDETSRLCIVHAPKGIGKTLALRLKSARMRHSNRWHCYPDPSYHRNLCDKLTSAAVDVTFGTEDTFALREKTWVSIWRLVLSTLAVRFAEETTANSQLNNLPISLESILRFVLSNRTLMIDADSIYISDVAPVFSRLHKDVAFFIDNVDEAFNSHIGYQLHPSYDSGGIDTQRGLQSPDIWTSAQVGIAQAIRDLREKSAMARFYVALRKEALDRCTFDTRQQLNNYSFGLTYTTGELRAMFEANIKQLPKDRLHTPTDQHTNPIRAFLGSDTFDHWFTGQPMDYFHFILRHTKGRPRDLAEMGRRLTLLPPGKRSYENIRSEVNDQAARLLHEYRRQTVPRWNDNISILFTLLPSNVIFGRDRQALTRSYQEALSRTDSTLDNREDPFLFLFRNGLLGFSLFNPVQKRTFQYFHLDCRYQNDAAERDFSNADVIFVHPCLEAAIRERRTSFYLFPNLLVGDGLDVSPSLFARKPHVHFGAGRIGLSVVAQELLSQGVPLAIVQRPSSEVWSTIASSRDTSLALHVSPLSNEKNVHVLGLVTRQSTSTQTRKAISAWRSGAESLFVLSDEERLLRQLLKHAGSLSISVQDTNFVDVIDKLVQLLPKSRASVDIFCFQNDYEKVNGVPRRLPSFARLRFVSVDRITVDLKTSTEHGLSANVSAERYCHYVMEEDTKGDTPNPFRGAPHCLLVSSWRELMYYVWRKKRLVNDVHAALAILAYHELVKAKVPASEFEHQFLNVVRQVGQVPLLDTFYKLQMIRALSQWDTRQADVRNEFERLRAFLDTVLLRFEIVPDPLTRIVGANVEEVVRKVDGVTAWVDPTAVRDLLDWAKQTGLHLGIEEDHILKTYQYIDRCALDVARYLRSAGRVAKRSTPA